MPQEPQPLQALAEQPVLQEVSQELVMPQEPQPLQALAEQPFLLEVQQALVLEPVLPQALTVQQLFRFQTRWPQHMYAVTS